MSIECISDASNILKDAQNSGSEEWNTACEYLIDRLSGTNSSRGHYAAAKSLIRFIGDEYFNEDLQYRILRLLYSEQLRGEALLIADIISTFDMRFVLSYLEKNKDLNCENIYSKSAILYIKSKFNEPDANREIIEEMNCCIDQDKLDLMVSIGLIALSHVDSEEIPKLFSRIYDKKNICKAFEDCSLINYRYFISQQTKQDLVCNVVSEYYMVDWGNYGTDIIIPFQCFPYEFREYPGWEKVREHQINAYQYISSNWGADDIEKLRQSLEDASSMHGSNATLDYLMMGWIDHPEEFRMPIQVHASFKVI